MHPLEQLRFVARGWESVDEVPVEEVAALLAELAEEHPAGLLHACRRLIEYFPSSGRLWWLSARALSAPEPVEGIWEAASELVDDPTGEQLAKVLPAGAPVELAGPAPRSVSEVVRRRRAAARASQKSTAGSARGTGPEPRPVVLFAVLAAGPAELLIDRAAAGEVRALPGRARRAWAVVPRGVVLPAPLWEQVLSRAGPGAAPIAPSEFAALVGPGGLAEAAELLGAPGCPPVAELLGWRSSGQHPLRGTP
jgi:hypothetical protein